MCFLIKPILLTLAYMTIGDITHYLESIAPLSLQESYDNSGLLTGDRTALVTGVLVSLDMTEEVLDEALRQGCNMVVAHHPIIFSGLKKLTGTNYIERTVIKAIREGIALYAIHTNLDNVATGVNDKMADKLGLTDRRILQPRRQILRKLVTFAPHANAGDVRFALFEAGAGSIGHYDHCSFNVEGYGTFRGDETTQPHVGQRGQDHEEPETRLEVIYPMFAEAAILRALRKSHPYEEIAYDIIPLENAWQEAGSGMIGLLPEPMGEDEFLQKLKSTFGAGGIRHTRKIGRNISRVALCGGAGSFLLRDAIMARADAFVTADFKYHQFFDADGHLLLADIGHYESEQYTKDLLHSLLTKKFANFAVHLSKVNTNPVNYL